MLLLYFHYTDNSYNRVDIFLTQLVLKRKSELNKEDEILEDEQKNLKNLFTKLMMKVFVFLFDLYYILMLELLR